MRLFGFPQKTAQFRTALWRRARGAAENALTRLFLTVSFLGRDNMVYWKTQPQGGLA